jgi:hypothetical protein
LDYLSESSRHEAHILSKWVWIFSPYPPYTATWYNTPVSCSLMAPQIKHNWESIHPAPHLFQTSLSEWSDVLQQQTKCVNKFGTENNFILDYLSESSRHDANKKYITDMCSCYTIAWLCKLQKGCTRLAAESDKAYQLLAHGRWFSLGTPASLHHEWCF